MKIILIFFWGIKDPTTWKYFVRQRHKLTKKMGTKKKGEKEILSSHFLSI
jgi:hypothetical protein